LKLSQSPDDFATVEIVVPPLMHEKRRDHACPHCAAAFSKASHVTAHVRVVHEKHRDHACPHCAAAFGRAGDLAKHVRAVHEKRRDHACPHCAAAFGHACHLKVHVRTVHGTTRRATGAPSASTRSLAAPAAAPIAKPPRPPPAEEEEDDDEAASLALALALSGGYAEPVRRSGRAAAITATVAIKVSTSAQPQ
jgi:hypothetical protein